MLRRTQGAADQSLKTEIEKVLSLLGIPAGAVRYLKQERTFYFPNCSTIKLGYCAKAEDYTQFMGVEYADIAIEELTQHEESSWDLVGGSNRHVGVEIKCKRWGTANPGGIGHQWVKKRYIDKATREPKSLFIQSLITDNAALLEADPGYARRVLDPLQEWQRKQWRDGDWNAISGAYFSINPDIIKDVEIPYYASWTGGVDWGSSSPFAVIYTAKWQDMSGRNHFHVVHEIYKAGLHLDEQAELVHEAERYLQDTYHIDPDKILYYADPSVVKPIETLSTEAGRTVRSVWAQHDFYVLPAHSNSRVPGWQLMKYLMHKEIMTVSPRCHALLNEANAAQYEQLHGIQQGEDLDKKSALGSHALDSLRYIVLSTFRSDFKQEDLAAYNNSPIKIIPSSIIAKKSDSDEGQSEPCQ